MQVAFFDFCTSYGGAPKGTVCLANRLSANHQIHIVDAYGSCELYLEQVKQAGLPLHILDPNAKRTTIGYNNRPWARLWAMVKQVPALRRLQKRLVRTVLEIDPDLVWVNNEKSLVLLASSFRLRKYPLVVYYRGWATPDQLKFRFRWLLKHKVKAIIAHAKATLEQMSLAGIPENKFHYATNAMDFSEIERASNRPVGIDLPGMDKRPRILLPAARPVRDKGHLAAARALARLKSQGYDPALWLPGEVAAGVDDSFTKTLKKTIRGLGIADNTYFLGWCDNFPALIKACDLVILPTHTEGFPRVVVEAMYLNKPVCATPVGGVPEAIIDGATGYIFEVDDDERMAELLKQLIDDPARREAIAERGHRFVVEKFRLADHTAMVSKAFESVISGK